MAVIKHLRGFWRFVIVSDVSYLIKTKTANIKQGVDVKDFVMNINKANN